MYAVEWSRGVEDAWANVAEFVPKLVAFLLILLVGWFVAKTLGKLFNSVLERVGFDEAVERGGIGRAMAKSQYDPSSLLGKVLFYTLMLFVLQLAFGVFGPNPVSNMIQGVVAYLPNLFVAILIVVVGGAISAAVKEIVEASLGGLSYGKALAVTAGTLVLVVAGFAALDQLDIAENIVNGLFYAALAIVVGSAVVAVGGGGITTMKRYWERAAQKAEQEGDKIKRQSDGATDRIQQRAQQRAEQIRV